VKDENGDLLADYHKILNTPKNCFHQLLNVNSVSDVPVPGPSNLETKFFC
jgi:hypothetical protein